MKGLLTRSSIESLKPHPTKETYLWDTRVAGFFVKCTRAGVKGFYLHYRMGGRAFPARRLFIGRCDWMSVEKARGTAQENKVLVHQGIDPFKQKEKAFGLPFSEVADRWVNSATLKKKPGTAMEDQRLLEKIVLPFFKNHFIRKISREDCERFHAAQAGTPIQANRALSVLRCALNYAVTHGHRPDNPASKIKLFKETPRKRYLKADEIGRFLNVLDRCEREKTLSGSFINLIRLLLFTGCRRDEIRLLRWDQVDANHGALNLPDTKTGPRKIHLNTLAVECLQSIKRQPGNSFVIPGSVPGEALHNVYYPWSVLCKAANLKDFRIHDLRHCFASLGVALNVPLFTIGGLLGHSQAATTARYSHLDDRTLKSAVESIGESLRILSQHSPQAGVVKIGRKK